ncbi:MAG: DNA-directed RNA polymerase subunit omega [Defluviitaleaceae bacterium]|nr:DNA-directed RNA polymerase subunit omega [Defluviitaleaceae bacterium]
MLRPSYSELMDIINTNELVDSKITSRYTIVLAAAKRARQITSGANPLTYAPTDRAVSIAVKEMGEGKLNIKVPEEMLVSKLERTLDQFNYQNISDVRDDMKEDYGPVTYGTDDEDEHESDEVIFRERFGDSDLRPEEEKDEFAQYPDDEDADDVEEDYEDE